MKNQPSISTSRMVEIFREMISCRRTFCADKEFFKMPDLWEWLCDDCSNWKIQTYKSVELEDYKRKAGVIAFCGKVTLSVDAKMMENAKRGCKLANFVLAHELGHLALDHHAKAAVTKNFQLFDGPSGRSNMPPTIEELEANYAAVFLQCGVALLDDSIDSVQLALRAYTDVYYVKKIRRLVRLDVFNRESARASKQSERVIL